MPGLLDQGDGFCRASCGADTAPEATVQIQQKKVLFGVATTVTGRNMEEVLSDAYVEDFIRRGAMYLWYYVYRPVGADPSPHFCVDRERMIELRTTKS